MAFQQPQRQQAPRPSTLHSPPAALPPVLNTVSATTRDPFIEQSQEWVLFSPATQHPDDYDSLHTPRSAAHSPASDVDSLDTAAVSDRHRPQPDDGDHEHVDPDNEDLDSLDDGLHAFNAGVEHSTTVLPAHDGLGMFPGTSSPVQEQLWQHERYNPRRAPSPAALERSSLDRRVEELDKLSAPQNADEERFLRIERWRLDQSRAILNEIERETRRVRRQKRLSDSRGTDGSSSARLARSAPESSSMHNAAAAAAAAAAAQRSPSQPPKRESLWERFKRHVIRDLMGLDDATLSYIFGEQLPTDPVEEIDSTPAMMIQHAERTVKERHELVKNTDSWEEKLLARIAQELGFLLHQIAEHPGAFNTYMKTQEPLPYAGLVTPRASRSNPRAGKQRSSPQPPQFQPTLGSGLGAHRRQPSSANSDPMLWGIDEEEGETLAARTAQADRQRQAAAEEQRGYWERDLDIKMVFGFLRSRLTSSSSDNVTYRGEDADPDPAACLVAPAATSAVTRATTRGDVLRRAALVRHQHPLVARKTGTSSRAPAPVVAHRRQSSLSAPLSPILGRRDSSVIDGAESCASQSTKKSKTVHSASLGGSSRNYWDLGGGSMGSAWGEA